MSKYKDSYFSEVFKTDLEFSNFQKDFNVYLNSIMSLIVWMKIGSFVMITKQFGIYIRMF